MCGDVQETSRPWLLLYNIYGPPDTPAGAGGGAAAGLLICAAEAAACAQTAAIPATAAAICAGSTAATLVFLDGWLPHWFHQVWLQKVPACQVESGCELDTVLVKLIIRSFHLCRARAQ